MNALPTYGSEFPPSTSLTDTTKMEWSVNPLVVPDKSIIKDAPVTGNEIGDIPGPQPSSTSVLGKVAEFFKKPSVIKTLKILTVLIVVGGLIAATVFTFGAAIPAIAAISSVGAVAIAKVTKMHKHTKENLSDIATFLGMTIITSGLITGAMAASGAGLGVKGIMAAKAGLGTVGTALFLGSGAAFVRAIIGRNG